MEAAQGADRHRLVLERHRARQGHPQRPRGHHLRRGCSTAARSGTGAARRVNVAFPEHIERVFDAFGVPADTKNAVYDLYVTMGEEALEVFGSEERRVGKECRSRW